MTLEQEPSSNDDAVQKNNASSENANQPWWATDPAIIAAREEVERWLESAQRGSLPFDDFEAIHNEVGSGSCCRELLAAKKSPTSCPRSVRNAVRAARAVGFSWGEIGRVLGVPRQLVHRRFVTTWITVRGRECSDRLHHQRQRHPGGLKERSANKFGLLPWLAETAADVVCLQETRADDEQLTAALQPALSDGWHLASADPHSRAATVLRFSAAGRSPTCGCAGVDEFALHGRYLEVDPAT